MDCQEELRLTREALEATFEIVVAFNTMFLAQQKFINDHLSIVAPVIAKEFGGELMAEQRKIALAAAKGDPALARLNMDRLSNYIPGSTTQQ
jgi:hypothetical protein